MPTKLTKTILQTHEEAITLSFCQRDYWLLAEHHPDILDKKILFRQILPAKSRSSLFLPNPIRLKFC